MTRTLRKGTRGPDVERWQRLLADRGHSPGKIDGIFGEGTAVATRAFQAQNDLVPDGVVGPKTLTKASSFGLRSIRRVKGSELTPALIAQARKILKDHHADPFGTEVPFQLAGVHYFGRIEEHFHPPGGPLKPWGHHPGVSLFVETVADNVVVAPDDVTEPSGSEDEVPDAPPVATRGIVVIDPGHGGHAHAGASSPNNAKSPSGVLEKELTLQMAKLVRDNLAERSTGVRVELTRTTDVNLDLADRAKLARSLKADLFLSLHFNGANGSARGTETLIRSKAAGNVNHEDDHRFAERVQRAVHQTLRSLDAESKDRGVKDQALGVLRDDFLGNSLANHPCRACLLEIEFLDVPAVDQLFNTGPKATEVRSKVAEAIAGALLEELSPE